MPSLLKFVPTQAASWLDWRDTPSGPVNALSVTGIVAPVLAVLNEVAITLAAPGRNRTGDIRAKTPSWIRYQVTWQARPPRTTTMNQSSDSGRRPGRSA